MKLEGVVYGRNSWPPYAIPYLEAVPVMLKVKPNCKKAYSNPFSFIVKYKNPDI